MGNKNPFEQVTPLQATDNISGLLNFLIHFRPKYLQARRKYAEETRLWCLKKAVFTRKIKPTIRRTNGSLTPSQHVKEDKRINFAGELGTMNDSSRVNSRASHIKSYSNIESIAEIASENDQADDVQSNEKKRSGSAKRISYCDEETWKTPTGSISSMDSIEEELEISRESTRGKETSYPVSTSDDSLSTKNLEISPISRSKRVSHTGEVEDVESD